MPPAAPTAIEVLSQVDWTIGHRGLGTGPSTGTHLGMIGLTWGVLAGVWHRQDPCLLPLLSARIEVIPFPVAWGFWTGETISRRISLLSSLLGPCFPGGVFPLTWVK